MAHGEEEAMPGIEVGEPQETSTSALHAAEQQRLSLRRAIAGLEDALAAPSPWPEPLTGALEQLRDVWAVHVEVTEGPGGLYEEILEHAPRLANRVNRLRREHLKLADGIRAGIADVHAAADPEGLRDRMVRLFADLTRHRKRGLDLTYEAYDVDIGGES
jgi:hypothetical protein